MKRKMFSIAVVFVVLGMASMACNIKDVEPGDGQVGEVVMDGYNGIRDAASEVKDAVDSTGEGLEVETHESPLPGLWDVATEIHRADQYDQCMTDCGEDDSGCQRNCEILWE